jgi:ubiquinol-cytochrome c reductase iron-sulfur subunit
MTDNGSSQQQGGEAARAGDHDRSPVPLDQGHVEGTGGIPARFADPGLPPHVHREADQSEKAARKAEKQVATMFTISIVATVLFVVAYFAVPGERLAYVPYIGQASISNLTLGLTLAVSLLFIGLGAVHWAKTLMPDEEVVELRHPQRSADADRQAAVDGVYAGGEAAQLGRRPLIKYTLGGALGLFAVPLVLQMVGGLGPLPGNALSTTMWRKGLRLMRDPEMLPVKASDVTIGSVYHIMPEGLDKHGDILEEKAKSAVLLMRLDPSDLKVAKARDWGYQGIVAYSKICTHVGCPVGLYEQQTHHLLCPCHQSTFDVTEDCKVIFGPAKRPLPQLPITVDNEGYLVARSAFHEAVGPSFWERG